MLCVPHGPALLAYGVRSAACVPVREEARPRQPRQEVSPGVLPWQPEPITASSFSYKDHPFGCCATIENDVCGRAVCPCLLLLARPHLEGQKRWGNVSMETSFCARKGPILVVTRWCALRCRLTSEQKKTLSITLPDRYLERGVGKHVDLPRSTPSSGRSCSTPAFATGLRLQRAQGSDLFCNDSCQYNSGLRAYHQMEFCTRELLEHISCHAWPNTIVSPMVP